MSTSSSSPKGRGVRSRVRGADQTHYRIGDISQLTGLSVDTLRYYEKIGLLPRVGRAASGTRVYTQRDLSRLRFIQRAKAMQFSLDEIARLLEMREDPRRAREEVRELARRKQVEVQRRLEELATLHKELTLLIQLCRGAGAGCPIIEDLDGDDSAGTGGRKGRKRRQS